MTENFIPDFGFGYNSSRLRIAKLYYKRCGDPPEARKPVCKVSAYLYVVSLREIARLLLLVPNHMFQVW